MHLRYQCKGIFIFGCLGCLWSPLSWVSYRNKFLLFKLKNIYIDLSAIDIFVLSEFPEVLTNPCYSRTTLRKGVGVYKKSDVGTWLLIVLTLEWYGFELCGSTYTQICFLVCLVVKTTVLHDLWLVEPMNTELWIWREELHLWRKLGLGQNHGFSTVWRVSASKSHVF